MLELAKNFIDKDCIIYYAFDNQLEGIIREVTDSAILMERADGTKEIVNPAFIIRIREHPKDKNGKKKSVVLD